MPGRFAWLNDDRGWPSHHTMQGSLPRLVDVTPRGMLPTGFEPDRGGVRTDPLHFRFNRRRPAVLAASLNFVCRKFGHGDGGPSTRSGIEVDPVPIIHRLRSIPSNGFETQVGAS